MLDSETKRRIDTARDILVGKVPDPKSQVEQITIALIYKFMDDMDADVAAMGGERTFFIGEFAQYGWPKLMSPSLGGHGMRDLYAEALERMPQNEGLPPLFRKILNDASLPYRDPETLRAFLKTINEFTYDHSEKLGDAFEYLLSVLGSQGDAGQFRTPRHIIDFMVAIVDPKKNEKVLDPACGTAGFLISSYKHILKANADKSGQKGSSALTPDEKKGLAANFKGYDISPDMVRLSLVNLYLHGFTSPNIEEYDTLVSQDRWNDDADVILANPPFMSPKGGIPPHNRFSIQSKRSEVLFVDYIAEHLTPGGRAGIIVPEGIIFQSQTAYRALRKMLVEQSLVAVISLPAGVFNPYSGVKTSILILDKSLTKQSDTVGFFKVENDGFGLGAQRRAIDKNDLPQVLAEIKEYLRGLRTNDSVASKEFTPTRGLIVTKAEIFANGDYNLSGERYRTNDARSSDFPIVPLGTVAEIVAGNSPPGESYNETGEGVPFYQGKTEFARVFIGPPVKWTTDPQRFAEAGDILMSVRAPVGPVNIATQRICIGRGLAAIKPVGGRLLNLYAFHMLRSQEDRIIGDAGAAFASINRDDIEAIEIPLPPLDVQKEIVAEIEAYRNVIDGARAVLDHYRPHIPINPEWPMVRLEDVCDIQRGKFTHRPRNEPRFYGGAYPFVQTGDVVRAGQTGGKITYTQTLNDEGLAVSRLFQPPIVLITIAANIGDTAVLDFPCAFPDSVVGLIPKEVINVHFLEVTMRTKKEHLNQLAPQAAQKNINNEILKEVQIPLPPLAEQEKMVAEFEAEQRLVEANGRLIERMEQKIAGTLARIWRAGVAESSKG
jgi:type I restriction enzyme M protein